ncbi:GAF domain-containing protein [Embleya sp. NBC_00896]|uniref:GAF domain-containing sensor histidine kinase n=1 Tax=Embleya sp. NBC_00896 TaxID=2975961 RepID=UPI003868536A|nr:GAF domain-containing protein [Embleya sp. NBC_00896]
MRLDELLDELQAHVEVVRSTRDRVSGLLEAVLSVGSDLDLETVLRRIVESATSLVDAEYGALGVIGDEDQLARFLPVGMDPETILRIGPFPTGRGILGLIIRDPHSLRLHDLTEHPDSFGFPDGHPPMKSFVGVPIRIREVVFGNLYLTEKRGGADFDEDDEAVLRTLAAAAGVAIDNARLYDDVRRREHWLAASSDLTRSLLSGDAPTDVLRSFTATIREMSDADLVTLALPVADTGDLVVEAADGSLADRVRGLVLSGENTLMGKVFSSGETITSTDLSNDPRAVVAIAAGIELGSAFLLPLGTRERIRGVLQIANVSGRPQLSDAVVRMVAGFADHAALALEIAERRRDAELLTVLQDRDRIARDLHDLAIQRLFATGMTLQSATRFIDHPEALERVESAVDALDETIKVIRSTIFSLKARSRGTDTGLRSRCLHEVDAMTEVLGFAPTLRVDGLLDTLVPEPIAEHVVAVLREALANTARHAHASRVEVHAETDEKQVRLRVRDNGVGPPAEITRRSGLDNLRERAESLGGSCSLAAAPDGGAVLDWHVPLSRST